MEEDIITFKEEAVKIISDQRLWNIIEDSRYEPIFHVLREKPMTVKDLTRKYNQHIYDFIEDLDLITKEKKKRLEELRRVEKTIYKYLNYLQKEKLIVKAGKRIQVDEQGQITQAASENLYGRTAKLYLFSPKDLEMKEKKDDHITVPILSIMLSLMHDLPKPSEKCLSEVMTKIFKKISSDRQELFEKYSEELADVSKDASYEIMRNVIRTLDVLNTIIKPSEFREELMKCFKS